jgi:hypothetical protein
MFNNDIVVECGPFISMEMVNEKHHWGLLSTWCAKVNNNIFWFVCHIVALPTQTLIPIGPLALDRVAWSLDPHNIHVQH